jgi:putative transposase
LSATRRRRAERGIWQRRYWEHTILTELDYARHVDYIHANPLKHGYVTQVCDWPYSTFHRYVRDGLLPMNWCGGLGDLSFVPDWPEIAG